MMKYIISILSLFIIIGCSTSDDIKETENEPEEVVQSDVSIRFSEMNPSIEDDMLSVEGETKTEEDKFYYTLEIDEKVVVEEEEVVLADEGKEWRAFEIKEIIDVNEIEDGKFPIIKVYAKDGERIINPSFIPLELGYY